ncbi:MAG: hypothetical protein J7L44_01365 [Candidatus Diapherotrites archaeon]|nr:hypothetical protein [Candidatus Diapherotrites archaeon]
MLVKKEESIRHENSAKCIAYEYPMGDRDINVAFVEIKGRYPDKGHVANETVKELIFVESGEAGLLLTIRNTNCKREMRY